MKTLNNFIGPLKVESGDTVYFVSDLHINHDKEFIWKQRGILAGVEFNSVNDYSEFILSELESIANENSTLINLGDTCFNDTESYFMHRFSQLPFKTIYSLPGNHRSGLRSIIDFPVGVNTLIADNTDLIVSKKRTINLSHFPPRIVGDFTWGCLCGHCHGNNEGLNINSSEYGRIFDCGVENALRYNGKIYFTLDEVLDILSKKERMNESNRRG